MAKKKEHSPKFELVKEYYDTGKWGEKAVRNAVTHPQAAPYITAAEYKEITGNKYE